jgi:hypothetical protein
LSPALFADVNITAPLPEAIQTLPDDPALLKAMLAKHFCAAQEAKLSAERANRQAEQYRELYEVSNNYNDELQAKLGSFETD